MLLTVGWVEEYLRIQFLVAEVHLMGAACATSFSGLYAYIASTYTSASSPVSCRTMDPYKIIILLSTATPKAHLQIFKNWR